MSAPIGFIGLGAMGWPMASCLARKGQTLIVMDASRDRGEKFASERGGSVASTTAEIAAQAQTIITMLPTSEVVESVLGGPDGLARVATSRSVLIEMSSGVPPKTRGMAAELALAIATDLAKETVVPVPFMAHCGEMLAAAAAMLGPGCDHTEIARVSEALAGLDLAEEPRPTSKGTDRSQLAEPGDAT